ncbi:MAG: pyridoxamine 5'-phosphate oxidase [Magnetovibrionaceae bacterium]
MGITETPDPLELFDAWFAEAEQSEPNDPNAMSLATVDESGQPSLRMVLLKGHDERGFVFYTNMESRKGRQLLDQPKAALCFHWKSLRRSVRIEGSVSPVSPDESDTYFRSRDRRSRIGAWASQQSRPLESRFHLEKEVARYAAKFNVQDVPRPDYWYGNRVAPERVEFWQDQPFRLHDRLVYHREIKEGRVSWRTERLFP